MYMYMYMYMYIHMYKVDCHRIGPSLG
jgi:hypothetical protein